MLAFSVACTQLHNDYDCHQGVPSCVEGVEEVRVFAYCKSAC
jgi:hypothetical protein